MPFLHFHIYHGPWWGSLPSIKCFPWYLSIYVLPDSTSPQFWTATVVANAATDRCQVRGWNPPAHIRSWQVPRPNKKPACWRKDLFHNTGSGPRARRWILYYLIQILLTKVLNNEFFTIQQYTKSSHAFFFLWPKAKRRNDCIQEIQVEKCKIAGSTHLKA